MDFLEKIERAKQLLDFSLHTEDIVWAKLLQTKDVVTDERVRLKCSHSGCPEYGRKLMCPPNTPSVDEFQKILSRYFVSLLVQNQHPIADKNNWKPEADGAALKLHEAVYRIEKKAFSLGFPFAAGLIGGACKLCSECAGAFGKKNRCIHPDKARPSMEAMGIDVVETCKRAGLEVVFSPEKVVWTGLILID